MRICAPSLGTLPEEDPNNKSIQDNHRKTKINRSTENCKPVQTIKLQCKTPLAKIDSSPTLTNGNRRKIVNQVYRYQEDRHVATPRAQ